LLAVHSTPETGIPYFVPLNGQRLHRNSALPPAAPYRGRNPGLAAMTAVYIAGSLADSPDNRLTKRFILLDLNVLL
jgi:hypothetical protein